MDNPESIHQTAIRSMAEKLATEHLNSTFSPEPAQPQTGFNGMDPYATKTAAAGLGLDPNATTLAQPPDSAQSLISQLLNPTDKYDPMNPAGYKHPSLMNALASFGGIYGRTHGQRVQAAEAQHREKMANIRAILGYKEKDQDEFAPLGPGYGTYNKRLGNVGVPPAAYANAGNRAFAAGPYDSVYDPEGNLLRAAPEKPYGRANMQWDAKLGKMVPLEDYQNPSRYKTMDGGLFDTQTHTYISADDPRNKTYLDVYKATIGNPSAWIMAGAVNPQDYAKTTALQAVENMPPPQTGPLVPRGVRGGPPVTGGKTGVQRIRELMAQGMDVDAATAQARSEGLK